MTESRPPVDVQDELAFRSYAMFVQSKLMSSIFDLDRLVDIAIDAFVELMRVDVGFIMLFDEKSQQLSVEAAKGLKKQTVRKTTIDLDKDIIQGIVEIKTALVFSELEETLPLKILFQQIVEKVGADIVLSIPMAIQNNLIGLINLGRKEFEEPFKQADFRFLYMMAEQVAMALQNANLYRKKIEIEQLRVTERDRAEEALRKTNDELEAKVEERTKKLKEETETLERINKLFIGRELKMKELKEEIKELKSKMPEGAG